MTLAYASSFAAVLSLPCIAQTPVLQWGHAFSGLGNMTSAINSCRGLTTDPDGNVYTVGEFANNLDLDPGTNVAMVTSEGLNYFDMFMAKYDSVGQYIWGKKITTGILCYANFLEREPGGDLVMAGYLGGTTDFDPGAGTVELTGAGDLFFARYSSDGDLVWAKTFGSASGIDELHAMELDANGNIWIAGAFNDTIDLDPGPGLAQFLCTPASRDGFFVKYDPDGNYLWGHAFGDNWSDQAKAIAFDANGNAVITGVFTTSMDVEPGAGTTMVAQLGGGEDTFVATYAPSGDLLGWFSFGGQASNLFPTGIAVDSNADLIAMGELSGSQASLTPGEVNGTISPGSNMYGWMAKYTPSGAVVWTALLPSPGSIGPGLLRLELDSDDDLHITGDHNTPFDADPGVENLQMIADGAYLLKYANADGALQWAVPFGNASGQHANELHIDLEDNIYLACGGNAAWYFNGVEIGGGNVAILMKTGECLPPEILAPIQVDTQVCEYAYVPMLLSAIGTGLHYQWYLDGQLFGSDYSMAVTGPIGVGPHEFQCIVTGLCGSDTSAIETTNALPWPEPVIIEVDGTLICQEVGDSYLWLLNGEPIPGATGNTYVPTENGIYTVNVTILSFCGETSPPYYYGGIGIHEVGTSPITILYQPGEGIARIMGAPSGSPVDVFDVTGHRIAQTVTTGASTPINLNDRDEGIYLVRVVRQVFRVVR